MKKILLSAALLFSSMISTSDQSFSTKKEIEKYVENEGWEISLKQFPVSTGNVTNQDISLKTATDYFTKWSGLWDTQLTGGNNSMIEVYVESDEESLLGPDHKVYDTVSTPEVTSILYQYYQLSSK